MRALRSSSGIPTIRLRHLGQAAGDDEYDAGPGICPEVEPGQVEGEQRGQRPDLIVPGIDQPAPPPRR